MLGDLTSKKKKVNINNLGPIPSFAVINTSDFLNNKRDRESDICCASKKCGKIGRKTDFINCYKCDKNYHAFCLEPPMLLKFINRFKWLCPGCKVCTTCGVNDGKLIRCNTCDRNFHDGKCMNITQIFGKTYCSDCICCKNCQKNLPIITQSNQNDFLSIKGYRVCDECWKYYKNKHYCPKCLKIYKQQNDSYKIYCSRCLNCK